MSIHPVPLMEDFDLWLTSGRCPLPLSVEDFGLWLTLGRFPGAPISGGLWYLAAVPVPLSVEDFGLWLTLGRCPGASIGGGLWSSDLDPEEPLPLVWRTLVFG